MDRAARMRAALTQVAPGTDLREGLERILRGRTGGLIVLGNDDVVEQISGGGFRMDVEFTSTGLRELAKMDGAVILDRNASRIVRAAVQLVPDPSIPTQETGTRHRTAERAAIQTGFPVISVSKSMETIALYYDGQRRVLEDSTTILGKANQALATLERYRQRLDEVGSTLSALEVEDLVTVRDVLLVTQRLEMVRRMSAEIDAFVVELGVDGRLLDLQLREVVSGVGADQVLLMRDYLPDADDYATTIRDLDASDDASLMDLISLATRMGLATDLDGLDQPLSPRGYRLLGRVPRLPEPVVERMIDHFGSLQKLLAASIDDLQSVDGVGEARARNVRDALSRLAESSILDRYQ
ncbi:MAG TPA: DNA integrity scanning diadenylate cyclase DisA [Actinomycetota bacterium]|nr:DNA integrity scanning diadenylate cyclase DisA [Actinomycetota bacterium]HPQ84750.1 DNA integrity scanning diadenylate cyclase DisA [Actinomycetota bacterium]HRV66316.1 DNA integrity scanning diadenylate cyclase DisA [Candidatus Nanopelagicales bacterium]